MLSGLWMLEYAKLSIWINGKVIMHARSVGSWQKLCNSLRASVLCHKCVATHQELLLNPMHIAAKEGTHH